jgi:hypothetical protein
MLASLQDRQRALRKGVGAYFVVSALMVALMMLLRFSFGGEAAVEGWLSTEMGSGVFSGFFEKEALPENLHGVYESFLQPLFKISILSWFSISLSFGLLFNLLLLKLVSFYQKPRLKKHGRFWLQFSRWKTPDWVLLPLVGGLGLLAYSHENLFPTEWVFSSWLGWNLTALALFPVFVGGIAVFSYLLPRLPFFLHLMALIVLILNPLPVLVVSGLADIWLDIRRKFRIRPKSEDDDSL